MSVEDRSSPSETSGSSKQEHTGQSHDSPSSPQKNHEGSQPQPSTPPKPPSAAALAAAAGPLFSPARPKHLSQKAANSIKEGSANKKSDTMDMEDLHERQQKHHESGEHDIFLDFEADGDDDANNIFDISIMEPFEGSPERRRTPHRRPRRSPSPMRSLRQQEEDATAHQQRQRSQQQKQPPHGSDAHATAGNSQTSAPRGSVPRASNRNEQQRHHAGSAHSGAHHHPHVPPYAYGPPPPGYPPYHHHPHLHPHHHHPSMHGKSAYTPAYHNHHHHHKKPYQRQPPPSYYNPATGAVGQPAVNATPYYGMYHPGYPPPGTANSSSSNSNSSSSHKQHGFPLPPHAPERDWNSPPLQTQQQQVDPSLPHHNKGEDKQKRSSREPPSSPQRNATAANGGEELLSPRASLLADAEEAIPTKTPERRKQRTRGNPIFRSPIPATSSMIGSIKQDKIGLRSPLLNIHGSPTYLGGNGSFGFFDTPGENLPGEFSPMGPSLTSFTGDDVDEVGRLLTNSTSVDLEDAAIVPASTSILPRHTSPSSHFLDRQFSSGVENFLNDDFSPSLVDTPGTAAAMTTESFWNKAVSRSPVRPVSERKQHPGASMMQPPLSHHKSQQQNNAPILASMPSRNNRSIHRTIRPSPLGAGSAAKPRKLWQDPHSHSSNSSGPSAMRVELGVGTQLKATQNSLAGINNMMRASQRGHSKSSSLEAPSSVSHPSSTPGTRKSAYGYVPAPHPSGYHSTHYRHHSGMSAQHQQQNHKMGSKNNVNSHSMRAPASAASHRYTPNPHSSRSTTKRTPASYRVVVPPEVAKSLEKQEPSSTGKENRTATTPSSSQAVTAKRQPCNCKKSKCLKLYCECFSAELFCDGCNCTDCKNTPEHAAIRNKAIKETRAKNPNAFKPRFVAKGPALQTGHSMGCKCKRSECLKKYCECFQAGILCGAKCKCTDCKNHAGSQKLIDKRRKMKDMRGAEFAMRVAEDAWKGQSQHRKTPAVPPRRMVLPSPSTGSRRTPMHGMTPALSHHGTSTHPAAPSGAPSSAHHYMRPTYMGGGSQPQMGPSSSSIGYSPMGVRQITPACSDYKRNAEAAAVKNEDIITSRDLPKPSPPDSTVTSVSQNDSPSPGTQGSKRPLPQGSSDNLADALNISKASNDTITSTNLQKLAEKTQVVNALFDSADSDVSPQQLGTKTTLVGSTLSDRESSRKKQKTSSTEEETFCFFGASVPKMPKKAVLAVFSFLSNDDVDNSTLVCSDWNRLAKDGKLWQLVV